MPGLMRKITAAAVGTALIAVSTGAFAAAPAAPRAAAATATATANPWVALSAMTSSSSAATAAAQGEEEGPGFPPIAPLVVIVATIALGVWILTKDNDTDDLGLPVSA